MGKRSVVIDIGKFNTKICVFTSVGQKYTLQNGAIFDTPNDAISDEFFQRCDIFLSKLNVSGSDLYVILGENDENYAIETEFPTGSNGEIEKNVKDRHSALSKDGAADCYYSWQTVGTPEATGQTRIMITYAKKDYVDKMIKLAERYRMKLIKVDIASTALDGMARFMQKTQGVASAPPNTMFSLLDIGASSANLVLFTNTSIYKIIHLPHTIFKLDEALTGSNSTVVYDKNLNREAVKMVPELVTQVPQYELYTRPLLTSLIKEYITATDGGRKFAIGPIFLSGGLSKLPYFSQKLANDLRTQCYDFPVRDFLTIGENCIYRSGKKIFPTDDVFVTALGTLAGGVGNSNAGGKKVNLIPSSYFLSKRLNVLQVVAIAISLLAVLVVSGISLGKVIEVNKLTKDVDESNSIIARADFKTRDQLQKRLKDLQEAANTENFNNIPTKYEEMTEFVACIMNNKPETMTLTKIDGEFTGTGVYSYAFSFCAEDRATIPPFLEKLQNEEILKYVNISAIELEPEKNGAGSSSNNTANNTQIDAVETAEGWLFTLTLKSKGGAN